MFLDALGLVSDAQAITADAVSTNTIDLGATTPARRIGDGEPVGFAMIVDVAADFTTGDETYAFEVISSAAANLGSPTVLNRRSILTPLLTAGAIHFFDLPIGSPVQRYIGMNYDVGGTTPTITVTTWFTLKALVDKIAAYAKGYTGPA